jgi:hypothetical protein
MPLHVYRSIYASGSIPQQWKPIRGGTIKYPIRERELNSIFVHFYLGNGEKSLRWVTQVEAHYFEHESGHVAGVKFFPSESYQSE